MNPKATQYANSKKKRMRIKPKEKKERTIIAAIGLCAWLVFLILGKVRNDGYFLGTGFGENILPNILAVTFFIGAFCSFYLIINRIK